MSNCIGQMETHMTDLEKEARELASEMVSTGDHDGPEKQLRQLREAADNGARMILRLLADKPSTYSISADPASVLPVLAHLVATGQATEQQRNELMSFLSGEPVADKPGAGEPVAWMWSWPREYGSALVFTVRGRAEEELVFRKGGHVTPLYAHPPTGDEKLQLIKENERLVKAWHAMHKSRQQSEREVTKWFNLFQQLREEIRTKENQEKTHD